MAKNSKLFQGVGLSARPLHYPELLSNNSGVDWIEVLIDNFLYEKSLPVYYLDQLAERYPISFHGVELSIGSTDPLDFNYLKRIKNYIQKYKPTFYSDHLCFVSQNKEFLHDLIPLPYFEESIQHLVKRIKDVQDFLERPLMIENVSSYLVYQDSHMTEGEFMAEIIKQTGCITLLDLNNCYVTQENHGHSVVDYLKSIPKESVGYIHLAGHTNTGELLLDTHSKPVCPEVWEIYDQVMNNFGTIPTCIEWDDDIPSYQTILAEVQKAKRIQEKVIHG